MGVADATGTAQRMGFDPVQRRTGGRVAGASVVTPPRTRNQRTADAGFDPATGGAGLQSPGSPWVPFAAEPTAAVWSSGSVARAGDFKPRIADLVGLGREIPDRNMPAATNHARPYRCPITLVIAMGYIISDCEHPSRLRFRKLLALPFG